MGFNQSVAYNLNPNNIFNARHTSKLSIDSTALAEWKDDGYFLLHHDDIPSHDPDEYSDSESYFAEGDMRKLSKAVQEGACIAASYSILDSTTFRVGYIEADTEVEYPTLPRGDGSDGTYKAVQFDDYTDVRYVECPVLFTASARQGSSFANWDNEARQVVRGIALSEDVPHDVFSLSDGQFELLCDSWLRVKFEKYYLRLPVGKTMKDIDIIATAKEAGEIAAQITLVDDRETVEQKVRDLQPYGVASTTKYLFAREAYSDVVQGLDIKFQSATDVFHDLDSNKQGQRHLDAMLDLSRVG